MFDVKTYQEYKELEMKMFEILLPGHDYRRLALRPLVERSRTRCKNPQMTAVIKNDLAMKVFHSIRLRCSMVFSFVKRSWFGHVAFVGALAYLRAALSTENEDRSHNAAVSRHELLQLLGERIDCSTETLKSMSYQQIARAVCEYATRQSPIYPDRMVDRFREHLQAHTAVSTHWDPGFIGFLTFICQALTTAEGLRMHETPCETQESEVDLEKVTIDDLEREAFYAELESMVDCILKLWCKVTKVQDVGPTALATQCVWRQLRSSVIMTEIDSRDWLATIPPNFVLYQKMQIVEWLRKDKCNFAPQGQRKSLETLNVFAHAIHAANFRLGILFDSLKDQQSHESWRFGLALILMLEEQQNRPTRALLEGSLHCHIDYVLEIMQTIPEAYDRPGNNKAAEQLRSYKNFPLDVDCCTWGLALAHVTASAYEASLIVMSNPPMAAIAHAWALASLHNRPAPTTASNLRFDGFLHEYDKILFLDGYPTTIEDCDRSRREWVTFKPTREHKMKTISATRSHRFKSSMRAVMDNQFSIRCLTAGEPLDNIEEECGYLIKKIQSQEQLIPDVLRLHQLLPRRELIQIACGLFDGSIEPLIAHVREAFGSDDYWSAAHHHYENN